MKKYIFRNRFMGNIKNEILQVAKQFNIKILEIPKDKTKGFIDLFISRYCICDRNNHIWENFVEDFSVKSKKAWEWIDKIIDDDEKVIMFFNPNDEDVSFEIDNKKVINTILGNTCGFEFYLTNKKLDYGLCFNHHDYLITCGKAIQWLKERLDKFDK